MLNDIQNKPNKKILAKSLKCLLESLGFYHVWVMQGVVRIYIVIRKPCKFYCHLLLFQIYCNKKENRKKRIYKYIDRTYLSLQSPPLAGLIKYTIS
jgi:hypothetical protein